MFSLAYPRKGAIVGYMSHSELRDTSKGSNLSECSSALHKTVSPAAIYSGLIKYNSQTFLRKYKMCFEVGVESLQTCLMQS